jgi:hypothetical protein
MVHFSSAGRYTSIVLLLFFLALVMQVGVYTSISESMQTFMSLIMTVPLDHTLLP